MMGEAQRLEFPLGWFLRYKLSYSHPLPVPHSGSLHLTNSLSFSLSRVVSRFHGEQVRRGSGGTTSKREKTAVG